MKFDNGTRVKLAPAATDAWRFGDYREDIGIITNHAPAFAKHAGSDYQVRWNDHKLWWYHESELVVIQNGIDRVLDGL